MPGAGVQRLRRARLVRSAMTNIGFVVVVGIVAVGMILVGFEYWRRGLFVIGAAAATGAVLRAVLPDHRLGLLRVRGRAFDVSMLIAAAAAILVVSWGISPLGTE